MLKAIDNLVKEFLELSKDKPVRIISHHDTDGITSAAILAKTFRRLHINFSVKIVKGLDEEILAKELQRNAKEILFFSDLASSNLEYFQELKNPVFILDHHEINQEKLNSNIKIINPHIFNEEETCGAGLCYLFSKAISSENKDLAKLAIIGLIGDRHENNISKINQQIISDTVELKIKKGLQIFSATRPLRKSLEYSTEIYIPGVTGSQPGVFELLRETNISMDKTLYELTDDEMSNLLTAIMIRRAKCNKKEDILGNIYLLKFFNRIEDVRELSVLINACSRLGFSEVALSFCMENEKARIQAQEIYLQYKQQLISALNSANTLDKIKGNGFVILNARDTIKDTIIGTVTSILSSSLNYEEGTVLIGMAYNQNKIKVSARIVGKDGRNLKEMLERVVVPLKGEVGGHKVAAGCLIEKGQEAEFIDELKKHLEIEVMKV